MEVVFNSSEKHKTKKTLALALGTFDGLHIGHRALIDQINLYNGIYKSAVYTFSNHPESYFNKDKAPFKIMTRDEKIKKFSDFSVDYLIMDEFNEKIASLEAEDFIEKLLIDRYNIFKIVVGFDFRFGYQAKGDVALLKELSKKHKFHLKVVPPVSIGDEVVSSSNIRSLISSGDMERASILLGRNYNIEGKVVHGYKRGRRLGFPTANLEFDDEKLVPQYGIYITKVEVDNNYFWGLTNIGVNPTFNTEGLFVETHLLDFDKEIYDSSINIQFIRRIREEIKFNSIEELKSQIYRDVEFAKNFVYKS